VNLKPEDPERATLVGALTANSREIVSARRPDIAADDISSVYENLAAEREAAKDEEGRKKVLSARAAFLEAEAASAKNADARAVFDSHRLSTYLELNEPARAIPMLEASERDLPDDYNPPAPAGRVERLKSTTRRWRPDRPRRGLRAEEDRILRTRRDLRRHGEPWRSS
jgi:hypothetical protein